MRAREVAVLENKVECTQHQLESTERVLRDADNAIDRLDKEFAKKSEAVEQLDSDIKSKSAELENTNEQLAVNQQLLLVTTEKVAQINDIDSINVKHSAIGSKVTLSEMDYNSIVELAKKELAAEHDTTEKDDQIYRLNEILQALNKEKALWTDERSALHKTIEKLRSQVRGLTDQLSALKAKYDKVMEFIEKFDLKEKLDNFLHPIKNIKKHKR
jgi:chromosome segregation ATPase